MQSSFLYKSSLSVLLVVLLASCGEQAAQTDLDKTIATISKQTIKDHVYHIASDEMRGRDVGTPEILKAADYIAEQLDKYGAKPIKGRDDLFQPVPLRKRTKPTLGELTLNGQTYLHAQDFWVFDGRSGNFNTAVIDVNYGREEDYEGIDVKGKFVIARTGDGEASDWRAFRILSREKIKIAKSNGALGLIEFYNAPTPLAQLAPAFNATGFVLDETGNTDEVLPHIWLNNADRSRLRRLMSSKTISVSLKLEGIENEMTKDRNVVAMIEGSDPQLKNEFVMFSAHYDHIGVGLPDAQGDSIYNGTRDNAIGVVTVLSAAQNIGKYPLKRSALFVLYTAEEKGLLGSRWMADNPLVPNKDIIFCWNSDNASYTDTSIATILGLTKTTAQPIIEEAANTFGLRVIEDPTIEQIGGLFDKSDNVNFARKGIPSPTFSLGFNGFDNDILKYYHQQADNPNSVDYDYLLKFFQSYVLASRMIANSPKRPFWVEGDEYYEIGRELYGLN